MRDSWATANFLKNRTVHVHLQCMYSILCINGLLLPSLACTLLTQPMCANYSCKLPESSNPNTCTCTCSLPLCLHTLYMYVFSTPSRALAQVSSKYTTGLPSRLFLLVRLWYSRLHTITRGCSYIHCKLVIVDLFMLKTHLTQNSP